jgi:hypothetical protein
MILLEYLALCKGTAIQILIKNTDYEKANNVGNSLNTYLFRLCSG